MSHRVNFGHDSNSNIITFTPEQLFQYGITTSLPHLTFPTIFDVYKWPSIHIGLTGLFLIGVFCLFSLLYYLNRSFSAPESIQADLMTVAFKPLPYVLLAAFLFELVRVIYHTAMERPNAEMEWRKLSDTEKACYKLLHNVLNQQLRQNNVPKRLRLRRLHVPWGVYPDAIEHGAIHFYLLSLVALTDVTFAFNVFSTKNNALQILIFFFLLTFTISMLLFTFRGVDVYMRSSSEEQSHMRTHVFGDIAVWRPL